MSEGEESGERHDGPGRAWLWAMLLALVTHGAFLVALRSIRVPEPLAFAAPVSDAIEVQLVPPPAAEPQLPRWFTEQPDDGTSHPEERADFLSNVDATAEDPVPGGEDALPASQGRADSPQVAMVPGSGGAPSAGDVAEAPAEPAAAEPATGGPAVPAVLPPVLAEALGSAMRRDRTTSGTPGTSDLLQEAMDSAANAAAAGDIRLSTTAWEYAPWLQAFRRALLERWHPPQAYFLGLIEGWALIEVEIARDGRMLRVDVLEEDVDHWSLTDAAVLALGRAAPYRALPASFPDGTLRVQIRFNYAGARRPVTP